MAKPTAPFNWFNNSGKTWPAGPESETTGAILVTGENADARCS
jgi:hypothetical protein